MAKSHKQVRQPVSTFVPMRSGLPISIHPGVTWDRKLNKWRASITRNGKTRHLGSYVDELQAKAAFDEARENLKVVNGIELHESLKYKNHEKLS